VALSNEFDDLARSFARSESRRRAVLNFAAAALSNLTSKPVALAATLRQRRSVRRQGTTSDGRYIHTDPAGPEYSKGSPNDPWDTQSMRMGQNARSEPSAESRPTAPAQPSRWAEYHRLQDEAISSAGPYPAERFAGRGIVIVASGLRHFTNAWVCISILRRLLNCHLSVQAWYLGPDSMSAEMIALLGRLDVECVDAYDVRKRYPVRTLWPWECKPYAILNSPFREVILLDADNVPLANPEALFASDEYRRTGAVFWADVGSIGPERAIWKICRVPYRDESEFQGGAVVVDKARCWQALRLTMHLNEWSDFYNQHLHGDKDTFHLAWRMLDQSYSMPAHRPIVQSARRGDGEVHGVFELSDFDGRALFHHRVGASKWTAWGENFLTEGFTYEGECLAALSELRRLWSGRVTPPPKVERTCVSEDDFILQRNFLYYRLGSDERVLEFLPDHTFGQGSSWHEQRWQLAEGHGGPVLVIDGGEGEACRLVSNRDGVWRGDWSRQERMPIELVPMHESEASQAGAAGRLTLR
jgi:hypothetical protein